MSGYGFPLQLFLVAMLLVGCAALLVIRNQGESAGRNRVGWAIFPVQQRSGAVLAALVLCLGGLLAWLGWIDADRRITSSVALAKEIPARRLDTPDPTSPEYASSDRCQACHPGQFASWHETYHRTMTQAAGTDSVLGRFEGQVLRARGRQYILERRGDEYWVEMADPDWERDLLDRGRRPEQVPRPPRGWKRIVMTTGSHHMQTYWVASGRDGRLFNFPWLWLVKEQRWIPREDGFIRPPGGARTFDVWHSTCIECHAVAGEKTRSPAGDWMPEAAELGIACEGCHGPAEEHVRANADPLRRYQQRLSDEPDSTIVNPARLDAQSSSEVCGHCHGMNIIRANALAQGKRFRPGGELADTRIVMRISEGARREATKSSLGGQASKHASDWEAMQHFFDRMLEQDESYLADRFWSDGMIRVSGREHNGMIESACFQGSELSCLTCHSMHDADPNDQLKASSAGDAGCLGCHPSLADNLEAHTHHPAESSGSRCNNCHMPHTVYGLMNLIRSHWIDVPSVETELATGRPNACSLCHLDRPLGWAADHLTSWYGQPRPTLSEDEEKVANGVRWLLIGDAHQRALTAWHLGWRDAQASWRSNEGWDRFFLGHLLDDPYSAVRAIAENSLDRSVEDSAGKVHTAVSEYDFLDPRARRRSLRSRVMEAWEPRRQGKTETQAAALLIQGEGKIDLPAFDRLAASRDDTEMDLRE
jgi:predicted CXXCH cytochrome family protein